MSSVYALEPETNGQAVLHTTHGPIDIFFWSSEAPLATRNFIQHALNGYYDNLPFHRIIPGVLAQTGDPTRTGTGGVPASGDPKGFARETHGRLKFRRRGLVAMVADEAGRVRSQFFITLCASDWLNGEHTLFACIQGDSIYNLMNLAGVGKIDGFDDENAPRVKSIEIIKNPFSGMVGRPTVDVAMNIDEKLEKPADTAKRAVKSKVRLSFADDGDSDSDGGSGSLAPKKRVNLVQQRKRESLERGQILRSSGNGNEANRTQLNQGDSVFGPDGKSVPKAKEAAALDQTTRNAETTRKANEAYERIKAELLGGSRNPDAKQPLHMSSSQDDRRDPVSASPNLPGRVTAFPGATIKKSRRRDEKEMLQRLAEFETNLRTSRRDAARFPNERRKGVPPWYSRGLKLGTQAMEIDEEYEVHFGSPRKQRR